MNAIIKCMPDMRSIETDMNIRDRHEHNDKMHAGREQYKDRFEHQRPTSTQ